jgi:hypothetical protein
MTLHQPLKTQARFSHKEAQKAHKQKNSDPIF